MEGFKTIITESGNPTAAKYDAETQELFVIFKGGKCAKYPNYSAADYQEFEKHFDNSQPLSAGKFFRRNISELPFEYVEV